MRRLALFICFGTTLTACGSDPAAELEDGGAMDAASRSPDSSAPSDGCIGSVAYEISFAGTWSAETHPDGFPPGPHFSPLIGAVHDDSFDMWTVGELASDGIESMAETGSTTGLGSEVMAAGPAASVIRGPGIGSSPGTASTTFVATPEWPRVSITTMLAPSPDWFVGLDAVALCIEGAWIDFLQLQAILHDAGTDGGLTYTAPNDDSDPPENIRALEEAPFHDGSEFIRVGHFDITRLD